MLSFLWLREDRFPDGFYIKEVIASKLSVSNQKVDWKKIAVRRFQKETENHLSNIPLALHWCYAVIYKLQSIHSSSCVHNTVRSDVRGRKRTNLSQMSPLSQALDRTPELAHLVTTITLGRDINPILLKKKKKTQRSNLPKVGQQQSNPSHSDAISLPSAC